MSLPGQIKSIKKWGLVAVVVIGMFIVWEDSRITHFYNTMDRKIVDTSVTEQRCDMLSDAVRFLPK